jgi:hypothetical protein
MLRVSSTGHGFAARYSYKIIPKELVHLSQTDFPSDVEHLLPFCGWEEKYHRIVDLGGV